MERMEAHKLQPHFVEAFFLQAFKTLGGRIHKREHGRYEITSVSQIFNQQNKLRIQKLASGCTWLDTNTFDGILNTCYFISRNKR